MAHQRSGETGVLLIKVEWIIVSGVRSGRVISTCTPPGRCVRFPRGREGFLGRRRERGRCDSVGKGAVVVLQVRIGKLPDAAVQVRRRDVGKLSTDVRESRGGSLLMERTECISGVTVAVIIHGCSLNCATRIHLSAVGSSRSKWEAESELDLTCEQ